MVAIFIAIDMTDLYSQALSPNASRDSFALNNAGMPVLRASDMSNAAMLRCSRPRRAFAALERRSSSVGICPTFYTRRRSGASKGCCRRNSRGGSFAEVVTEQFDLVADNALYARV